MLRCNPTRIQPGWRTIDALRSNRASTRAASIARTRLLAIAVVFSVLVCLVGCRITNIDSARRAAKIASFGKKSIVNVKRKSQLRPYGPVRQLLASRPEPSERTQLFLRKNNLSGRYATDPQDVVTHLHDDCLCEPNMESVHAIAELSQLEADWHLRNRHPNEAAKFFAAAVVHSYQFLFDSKLNLQRNAYDPQFREICDIYNQSLENLLRLVCHSEQFKPETRHFIGDDQFGIEVEISINGRWDKEEFERFELVNDFEIEGLDNNYHTYGLGVPLIAIRKPEVQTDSPLEKYYPPELSLPMTAFCEVVEYNERESSSNIKAVLRLYDPLEKTVVKTKTRNAPLESDLTVPLAYYLNDPLLNTDVLSTVALLDAEVTEKYFGFYMLEPFNAEKIPVVMVHGLWSNPVTWMKMFNDLRANEWIREHYQFWFYMYPTGQPFWFSAQEMREDLAQLREDVDPAGKSQPLKEMVLVGHSMGGLLSRMQTVDSGDRFWEILSEQPIDQIKGDAETVARVKSLFYFEADPNISRVVTIASPHRGSSYANNATRWLSHKLFRLPSRLTSGFADFCEDNRDILRNTKHMTIPTSVDSLAPDSPFIQKLAESEAAAGIRFHNIIGNVEQSNWLEKLGSEPGDGVVSLESAELPNSLSKLEVPAEHQQVHQHPQAILEVKRILIENLVMTARIDNVPMGDVRQASHSIETDSESLDVDQK